MTVLASCALGSNPVSFTFPDTFDKADLAGDQAVNVHGIATTFGGHIPVFVGPSAKPQILHLTSVDAAIWRVYLLPDANVSRIYVSGFEPQRLTVHQSLLDPGVRMPELVNLGTNLQSHDTLSFGPPIRFDEERDAGEHRTSRTAANYRAEVERVTGHKLTHFQGYKHFRAGEAIALPADAPLSPEIIAKHFRLELPAEAHRPPNTDFERAKADIATLIDRGALPSFLPLFNADTRLSEPAIEWWKVSPQGDPAGGAPASSSDCGSIQLGTGGDDALYCDAGSGFTARTTWLIGGGGEDIIRDARSKSQFMSGGPGDDLIIADLGNDVLHFGAGWGHDVVAMRCQPFDVANYRRHQPAGEPRYMHSRYIVFGSGVRASDLAWERADLLVDRRTGDSIFFAEGACAFLVAVDGGEPPPLPGGAEEAQAQARDAPIRGTPDASPDIIAPSPILVPASGGEQGTLDAGRSTDAAIDGVDAAVRAARAAAGSAPDDS